MLPDSKPVIGIDYSMTCPALCVSFEGIHTCFAYPSAYKGDPIVRINNFEIRVAENDSTWSHPIERFDKLARKVLYGLNNAAWHNPTVYIEGYSMGSKGQVFHIAENAAILKHYFYRMEIPVIEVAPTTVKKFATGSGRAMKDNMYDAFVAKTGIELQGILTPKRVKLGSPVTDIVDAYFIAEYGRVHHNEDQENGRPEIVRKGSAK